ncbi:MAG: hypothetical protein ACTSVU_04130 [Promethearchaeota archaeon]
MKKLVLIQWDMKMGPQNIIQFPPEAEFPPKEVVLKIWAHHEMGPAKNFITHIDQSKKQYYCCLIKKQKITNNIFFILLELSHTSDPAIFEEILEDCSEDLLNNLNKPHFSHVLSDIYKIIKIHSNMDEDELFLNLIEDKVKINLLEIFRLGVISKYKLKTQLKEQFGYINLNINLLLSAFTRLGLIEIKDLPGQEECIFLIQDIYCCRLVPRFSPKDPKIIEKIQVTFQKNQIFTQEQVQPLIKLMIHPGVKEMLSLLKDHKNQGILHEIGLTILKNDQKTLDQLCSENIIAIGDDNLIYEISELRFIRFTPDYLPKILLERYNNLEISFNQLEQQIDLLNLFQ